MNEPLKSVLITVPIALVSIVMISVALILFVISLLLGITLVNLIGAALFVLTAIAAKTGIRNGSWNWTGVAGFALAVGWAAVYSANIEFL